MSFWFKNKYDLQGEYQGKLIVSAPSVKKANRKMHNIESMWSNGLHLGDKIHGPYTTKEKAKIGR